MIGNYVISLNEFKQTSIMIGKGGFGKVYIIEEIATKNKYAAKISNDNSLDVAAQKYMMNEIQVFPTLKCPTTLRFIGYNLYDFNFDARPTIITEYMPNESLRDLFNKVRKKKGPKDWDTTKYIILLGLVLALKYLHEKGIIHRDIKPDNILLDEKFYPRLCDFGFSKISNEEFKDFVMVSSIGTQYYMAPEIRQFRDYDYTVDIYSFGLTLFELVTLVHHPFNIDLINGNENKKFFKDCCSDDPSDRPSFDVIYEFIQTESFISIIGNVNKDEVNKFLKWYKKTDQKLNKSTSDDEFEEEEKNENENNNNDNNNNNNNNNNNDNDNNRNDDVVEDSSEEDINENEDDDVIIPYIDSNRIRYELNTNKKTATIVGIIIPSNQARNDVFICSFITFQSKEYKITSISDNAFSEIKKINMLSFAENSKVRRIGNQVFKNSSITSLYLPGKLKLLGDDWCQGTDHLIEVTVDENNRYFSSDNNFLYYIYDNKNEILFAPRDFEGIYLIEEGVTRVGNSCFSNVRGIQHLVSQSGSLETIGSFAFHKCESLQDVKIKRGNNLKIGDFSFAESSSLTSIEFDCNSLEIGEKCFENCSALSNVSFKNHGKTTLGSQAFKGCNALFGFLLFIRDDIEIGNECFKDLTNFRSFALKAKSISLGERFIQNCSLLSFLNIQSEQDLTISEEMFDGCNNLMNVSLRSLSILKLNDHCFKDKRKLDFIELSGKMVDISSECFENCISLRYFFIKDSGNVKLG